MGGLSLPVSVDALDIVTSDGLAILTTNSTEVAEFVCVVLNLCLRIQLDE